MPNPGTTSGIAGPSDPPLRQITPSSTGPQCNAYARAANRRSFRFTVRIAHKFFCCAPRARHVSHSYACSEPLGAIARLQQLQRTYALPLQCRTRPHGVMGVVPSSIDREHLTGLGYDDETQLRRAIESRSLSIRRRSPNDRVYRLALVHAVPFNRSRRPWWLVRYVNVVMLAAPSRLSMAVWKTCVGAPPTK